MILTRYPLRVDAGFLVRKRWEWMGFSPGGRYEPGVSQAYAWVRLISAKNL